MKVVFSKYARQELDDATQYYEIEYQGLGKRFRDEVRKAAAFLGYIAYRGRAVAPSPLSHALPDPDDEPFLEVTLASQAVCLVTGNQKHFPAERCQGAKVISPNEFLIFFKNQQAEKERITKRSTRTRKKPRAS